MAKTPEAKVKDEIRATLKSFGPRVWWFMPIGGMFTTPGIPDFVGSADGKMFAIEAKAKGGRTTAVQEHIHRQMRLSGAHVIVIKPSTVSIEAQVTEFINPLLGQICQQKPTSPKSSCTEHT